MTSAEFSSFEALKCAISSAEGFAQGLTRKPRGYKREVFRRIITGQVPCRLHQLLRRVLTLEDKSIVDSAGMDALILRPSVYRSCLRRHLRW